MTSTTFRSAFEELINNEKFVFWVFRRKDDSDPFYAPAEYNYVFADSRDAKDYLKQVFYVSKGNYYANKIDSLKSFGNPIEIVSISQDYKLDYIDWEDIEKEYGLILFNSTSAVLTKNHGYLHILDRSGSTIFERTRAVSGLVKYAEYSGLSAYKDALSKHYGSVSDGRNLDDYSGTELEKLVAWSAEDYREYGYYTVDEILERVGRSDESWKDIEVLINAGVAVSVN